LEVKGRSKVGRNISFSHCNGQRLVKETGEFVDYTIDILGNYTPERATRYAQRLEHDKTIIISNVEIEKHYYCMDMMKFIELSERTN